MAKLLLVDDDAMILSSLTRLVGALFKDWIGSGELEIVTAADGEEAVAVAGEHDPDLIIMDVNMPKLDGVSAFFEIARSRGGAPTATVFLTGYAASGPVADRVEEALRAGALGCLHKPVAADQLAAIIRSAIGSGR